MHSLITSSQLSSHQLLTATKIIICNENRRLIFKIRNLSFTYRQLSHWDRRKIPMSLVRHICVFAFYISALSLSRSLTRSLPISQLAYKYHQKILIRRHIPQRKIENNMIEIWHVLHQYFSMKDTTNENRDIHSESQSEAINKIWKNRRTN